MASFSSGGLTPRDLDKALKGLDLAKEFAASMQPALKKQADVVRQLADVVGKSAVGDLRRLNDSFASMGVFDRPLLELDKTMAATFANVERVVAAMPTNRERFELSPPVRAYMPFDPIAPRLDAIEAELRSLRVEIHEMKNGPKAQEARARLARINGQLDQYFDLPVDD